MKQHHLLLNIRYWIGLTLFLFITPTLQAQIYVDTDAVGANNGSSWTDAYTSLQDALGVAVSENEIWVAEGTYYPDEGIGLTDNDRGTTFQLKDEVEIYGGFDGGEASVADRDWTTNPTILSGDINQSGDLTGNSRSVVTGSGTSATAFLDGFTIMGGIMKSTEVAGCSTQAALPPWPTSHFPATAPRAASAAGYLTKPVVAPP